ncbi:MAG: glycosyltransferase family 9 protein, partial [Desulfobacterota bacterium]|nr:glycosyltransferase family 9 protein [Thermodesulfobacteriota bacterium]
AGLYTLYSDSESFPETIKKLFSTFDLAICYSSDSEGNFTKNLKKLGIPWVIKGSFPPQQPIGISIAEFLLTFLSSEGIPTFFCPPHILPSPEDYRFAQKFFRTIYNSEEQGKNTIAIHPGSGSPKKCWPIKKFIELIRWIKKEVIAKILLIIGPAESKFITQLELSEKNDLFIARNFPLNHLAAILQQCSIYIGNDSGITHLAAAVGTPTLAIFGPTDFRIWGPRNKKVRCLYSFYPCAPCSDKKMIKCEYPFCLDSLPVETVKKAFLDFYLKFGSPFLTANYGN